MISKLCPACNKTLNIDLFYMRSDRKETTHSYCKDCVNEQTKKRQRNLKLKAIEYKGGVCNDCGGVFPAPCFDFHHENPEEKDFTISKLRSLKWSNKVTDELDKCVLLCANCHRLRHSLYF